MAEKVAQALNRLDASELSLFPKSDRQSLVSFIHDYFCDGAPEEMSSGRLLPMRIH